jgi:phospholipid/cholesterol/gamma-HCH transport system permease protein
MESGGAAGPVGRRRYHRAMSLASWNQRAQDAGSAPIKWLAGWGRILFFGAALLVLAGSPSSYSRETRRALVHHVYSDTAPILAWFTTLAALLTVVITRIVVVTAASYGLSRYALEMVIRVLVIELIPLTAALFVALRCTIPNGVALAAMRRGGEFDALAREGRDPVVALVLPRVLAGIHATITLAALSCVVALVLAYIAVYGFTAAGVASYTRVFGHVFDPAVSLVFVLKTAFFALAVAIIPMASGIYDIEDGGSRETAALQGLVRMFAVLLVLEAASLAGNYY